MNRDLGMLSRTLKWMAADRWVFVAAMVAAPLSTAAGLAQPVLLARIVDAHVHGTGDGRRLATWWLAAVLVGFVAEAGYLVWLSRGALGTITRLRRELYLHILDRPLPWHDWEPSGRLLSRVTSDVEALGETLTAGAVTLVMDVLVIVGLLATMFALDPRLAGVLLLVAPPLALVVDLIRRQMRTLFQHIRNALAELTAFVSERLAGHAIVQLYSDEARATRVHQQRLDTYIQANVVNNFWDALLFAVVDGVSAATLGLILWWAAGHPDAVTAGLLAAFVDIVGRLFTPIRELSGKVAILQRAATSLEKILAILDDTEDLPQGAAVLPSPLRRVTARDSRFAYPGGPDVLQGIDLDIAPGTTVALVGRTGSGKTTLGRLVSRAIGGHRGGLHYDGVDADTLEPRALRAQIGVVHQDAQLFPGTVRHNLQLGQDLPDDVLLAALAAAQASDIATRLGGLDGRVEAGGKNLSAGEGQLLSFARAMAHDCPFLVLDEPTASVDSRTEARLAAATQALLHNRTVLVVAHRLSTVVHADEILLLDHGRVLERGTHGELLAAGGAYAALWDASTRGA